MLATTPVELGFFTHDDIVHSDSLTSFLMTGESFQEGKQPSAADLDAFFAPATGATMEPESWSSSDEVRTQSDM